MIPFEENKRYYTTGELKRMGYSYYMMGRLENDGFLRRINRATYENLSFKGEENDLVNAAAYVPDGVICLMSAARYHGITYYLPEAVDIAIERKGKVSTLPDWPELKVYYFDPLRLEMGVTEVKAGGDAFQVFDVEKTVVDIIYYRNRVGIEEAAEVLRYYLKRRDRNIDKIHTYSKLLRCESIVRNYLEVMLV